MMHSRGINMANNKISEESCKKAVDLIVDDLRDLYDASGCTRNFMIFYGDDFLYLEIGPKKIVLKDRYANFSITGFLLEKKDDNGNIIRFNSFHKQFMLPLLREYEKIREKLVNKIKLDQEQDLKDVDIINKILKKYDKEASIEKDLPPSKNPHPLEVTEKDGKKIGVIDFGDRTIKIITNGDIVLVNKDEVLDNTNVKQKSISN